MNRPLSPASFAQHEPQDAGAAPVGQLQLYPEDQALWVRLLRLWCEGAAHGDDLARLLVSRLGAEGAERFMPRLSDLFGLILGHARRPLLRHKVECNCVGADEAAVALFCSVAGSGDREDAMMIACLIVRADVAPIVVSLAQTLALDLRRGAVPRHFH